MRDTSNAAEILIIDDDPGLSYLIQATLEREGYRVNLVRTGLEALTWLGEERADLLLIDYRLPDMQAGELIDGLAAMGCEAAFVIITGYGDERVAVDMMKRGARDYLCKDAHLLESIPKVVARVLTGRARDRRLAFAEQALDLYSAALKQASEALVILELARDDSGARILYANPAFSRLTGVDEVDLYGRALSEFVLPLRDPVARRDFEAALAGKKNFQGVVGILNASGVAPAHELKLRPASEGKSIGSHVVLSARAASGEPAIEVSADELARLAGRAPAAALPSTSARAASECEPAQTALAPRSRLLVVEDERLVRDLIVKTLSRAGYEVESSADPLEALDSWRDRSEPLDLVISDMMLPSLSGTEFVARLRERNPGVRVIYMSGYGEDSKVQGETGAGRGSFLAKPFSPTELLAAVHASLQREGSGRPE